MVKSKSIKQKKRKLNQKSKRKTKRNNKIKNLQSLISIPKTTILGIGKDGCIIDSISCGEFSKENGYVAKYLFNDKHINIEINSVLESIDPDNIRFNRYYLPIESEFIESENYRNDFIKCSEIGEISNSNMVFQKRLEPLDTTKLSKIQYRFLRDSLQILHKNGISHGDLPNNVMLDPISNMPIIIDWEEAKLNADELDKQIDMNAFFDQFKVKKINSLPGMTPPGGVIQTKS
jgi:serine/threonine protein kinase